MELKLFFLYDEEDKPRVGQTKFGRAVFKKNRDAKKTNQIQFLTQLLTCSQFPRATFRASINTRHNSDIVKKAFGSLLQVIMCPS